jgi:hypothetical protein
MIMAVLLDATGFSAVYGFLFIVFIIMIVFFSVIVPLLFIVPTVCYWLSNRNLRQNGEPARAKILEIWDTGVSVNDNPQVGMLLEVYAKDHAPFQAKTKSIISRLHIPSVQPGCSVEVRFDRQNPSKVALVM